MKKIHYFAVSIMLIVAGAANAQDWRYFGGEGGVECGDYLKHRKENKEFQSYIYSTWMKGFLSGYNSSTSGNQTRALPSSASILAYLDKYCRENPLALLIGGANALTVDLGATK